MQSWIEYNDKNMSLKIMPFYFHFNDDYDTVYDLSEIKGISQYTEELIDGVTYQIILIDKKSTEEITINYSDIVARNTDYLRVLEYLLDTKLLPNEEK